MKITFLGTSAATSFPLAFCNCKVCLKARENKGKDIRKRSSLVIDSDILIDLGPDVVTASEMYNINLTKIKYILQTHGHSDHFDAGHLITRLKEYATENVSHMKLYASKETVKSLDKWLKTEEPDANLFDAVWLERLYMDVVFLNSDNYTNVGDYSIMPLESLHDVGEKSLCYIIGKNGKYIFYGTDLLEISNNAWDILRKFKLDLVILDQTYGDGFNAGGHLDSGQVIEVINKMKSERIIDDDSLIYATHISHEGNNTHDEMENISVKHGYNIAYDGLVVKV